MGTVSKGACRRFSAALLAAALLAGCSTGSRGDDVAVAEVTSATAVPTTAAATTSAPATTIPPTTAAATTTIAPATTTTAPTTTAATVAPVTTTTAPAASTSTTTVAPTTSTVTPALAVANVVDGRVDLRSIPVDVETEFGRSVEGRPITVVRRGTPGGIRVLAVGCIHGNEDAGVAVIDRLRTVEVPDGIELWLVRSMNPDGQAIGDRQNANLVDLNRNFPENWGPLGTPGDWQYGGPSPASEPETRAMVALGDALAPELVLWYHQDLYRIAPGSGRSGEIRTRYAELTALPIVDISGGTYTGTAAQWARAAMPDGGVTITVELGETITEAEIAAHTAAVLTVPLEFW